MKTIKNKAKGLALIRQSAKKGFTLLELLIVIAILAVLSVTLVLVLNPAESLRKSRDTQRMSDLATLKTAIGLYLTTVKNSDLDLDAAVASLCYTDVAGTVSVTPKIAYSSIVADMACTAGAALTPGADAAATVAFAADNCYTVATGIADTDGTGWLPVDFGKISGGSPISGLPLDPTNTTIDATPAATDLVYRYACQMKGSSGKPSNVFEINAVLESDAFTVDDKKMEKDGGDNDAMYEVGTSVKLLPATGAY